MGSRNRTTISALVASANPSSGGGGRRVTAISMASPPTVSSTRMTTVKTIVECIRRCSWVTSRSARPGRLTWLSPAISFSRAQTGTLSTGRAVPHLGHDQALVEARGRQRGERQHGDQEAGRDPGHERERPPHPGQADGQHHQDRDERPPLDGPGEPERRPAPRQPPAAGRQPVPVEHRHRAEQAEQHQPRLDQHGMGGRDGCPGTPPAPRRRSARPARRGGAPAGRPGPRRPRSPAW